MSGIRKHKAITHIAEPRKTRIDSAIHQQTKRTERHAVKQQFRMTGNR